MRSKTTCPTLKELNPGLSIVASQASAVRFTSESDHNVPNPAVIQNLVHLVTFDPTAYLSPHVTDKKEVDFRFIGGGKKQEVN